MRSHPQEDKLHKKRLQLVQRTAAVLHCTEEQATALLQLGRRQSIRINTLRPLEGLQDALVRHGWQGSPYAWYAQGRTVENGLATLRDSPLVMDGHLYIQNAASWIPALVLDPQPGDDILDVCAAPGGKTSHLAALAHNQAHITANDNSRPRLAKLQANMHRMGAQNVSYTLFDATQLAHKMSGLQFDRILLDAPCSGEGMMTLSDKDLRTWSVAHIKRLQQLQKRIIAQAWQLLRPGGTLVYSTCTIGPEENEAVIDYFFRHNSDADIVPITAYDLPNRVPAVLEWHGKSYDARVNNCLRLQPSQDIEAFFVCCLRKQ